MDPLINNLGQLVIKGFYDAAFEVKISETRHGISTGKINKARHTQHTLGAS